MEAENDPRYIAFKEYLESIGGLENGYFTDKPPLKEPLFMSIGSGWYPLVLDLIKELIALGWNREICQVKEKLGGLRFYINEGTDEIYDAIAKAESKSYKICEICGESGELRTGSGWWSTLCDEHAKK